jgi:hypothetical protein
VRLKRKAGTFHDVDETGGIVQQDFTAWRKKKKSLACSGVLHRCLIYAVKRLIPGGEAEERSHIGTRVQLYFTT